VNNVIFSKSYVTLIMLKGVTFTLPKYLVISCHTNFAYIKMTEWI